ncbi:hypothetical protein ETC05_04155 [Geobacillus sp. BMUD]|nr:hypothetical protein [Geobacillus sp. BMUD]
MTANVLLINGCFKQLKMKGEKIHVNCTSMDCDVDKTDGRLDLTEAEGGGGVLRMLLLTFEFHELFKMPKGSSLFSLIK